MSARTALLVVAALTVAAGCIGGEEDGGEETELSSGAAPVSGWDHGPASNVTLNLATIPEGAEWVAVELASLDGSNATISSTWADSVPLTTDVRRCGFLAAEGHGTYYVALRKVRPFAVTVRPPGEDPLVERHLSPGRGSFSTELPGPDVHLGEDGRAVVVVGFNDPRPSARAGAWLNVSMNASEPVRWRVLDAGPIECLIPLHSYEGGTLVQVNGRTVGRNLVSTFQLDGRGYGAVFPYSTGRHDFRLEGPEGSVWEEEKTTLTEIGIIRSGTILEGLGPGAYEAQVEQIVGHSTAGAPYLVADLTPSVAEALQEPEASEGSDSAG